MRHCPRKEELVDEKMGCMGCIYWMPEKSILCPCVYKKENKGLKDNNSEEVGNA